MVQTRACDAMKMARDGVAMISLIRASKGGVRAVHAWKKYTTRRADQIPFDDLLVIGVSRGADRDP